MLNVEELEAALARLDAPLHQMEEYKYMYAKMERLQAVVIGKSYTDFGLDTPEGEFLKISDVHQGNVLLIDFWASWCGPCRRANPEVVEIYNTYHDQGFEIVGISFDDDQQSLERFVKDRNMEWVQYFDGKRWENEYGRKFGIHAIPAMWLLGKDGRVVDFNARANLPDKIEKLVNDSLPSQSAASLSPTAEH